MEPTTGSTYKATCGRRALDAKLGIFARRVQRGSVSLDYYLHEHGLGAGEG